MDYLQNNKVNVVSYCGVAVSTAQCKYINCECFDNLSDTLVQSGYQSSEYSIALVFLQYCGNQWHGRCSRYWTCDLYGQRNNLSGFLVCCQMQKEGGVKDWNNMWKKSVHMICFQMLVWMGFKTDMKPKGLCGQRPFKSENWNALIWI